MRCGSLYSLLTVGTVVCLTVLLPTAAAERTNEPNTPVKYCFCQTFRREQNAKLKNSTHYAASIANTSYNFVITLARGSYVIKSLEVIKLFFFILTSYSFLPVNWTTLGISIISCSIIPILILCLISLMGRYFRQVDVKTRQSIDQMSSLFYI